MINELLNEFEAKCIRLGELQSAQQMIKFPIYLQNGRALLGEINILIKEIQAIKDVLLVTCSGMDKLKELMQSGWIVSGTYDGEYHLVAADNGLDNTKTAIHADLEEVVKELYEECIGRGDQLNEQTKRVS